jgi:hypothetical protein
MNQVLEEKKTAEGVKVNSNPRYGDERPMPSSWSCEPTDSVVILSYDSIACA